MAEIERTRTREREPLAENYYERFMRSRQAFVDRQKSGPVVIKAKDRDVHLTRQGRIIYFLDKLTTAPEELAKISHVEYVQIGRAHV